MSSKKTNKVKVKLETEGGEVAQVPNNKKKPFKIERGGIAKPLGNGFYYLKGKSHEDGGIDMTFNTDARIFSSVPFLNGKSPAERVMEGENPDTTFAWQEGFKDVNGINDDGSKKAQYGTEEVSDNTRVQMPKPDVEPIKISDEQLRMEGWRTVDYGNGEVELVPPPASGALTPVYPEFELIAGMKELVNVVPKQVINSILPKRRLNSAFHKLSTIDNFKLGNIKQNNKYNGVIKAAEDTKSFFEEDVIPRINKLNEKVGILGNKRYSAINKDLEDIGVEVLNARSGKISGYSTSGDVTVPIKGRRPNETMVHEVHHAYRNKYGENRLKQPIFVDGNKYTIGRLNNRMGYSNKDIKILDEAYDFTEDYLTKNDINPLYEKGASNTEMRYILSKKNNNVVGQELDNIINSLSESDIIELLEDTNGYTENFAEYIKKLSNKDKKDKINSIKFALQRVGGYTSPLYLTNELMDNKVIQTKNNSNKKRLGGSTGLIRVQANGKDRLMYVPFTGEETKAGRKKALLGTELSQDERNKLNKWYDKQGVPNYDRVFDKDRYIIAFGDGRPQVGDNYASIGDVWHVSGSQGASSAEGTNPSLDIAKQYRPINKATNKPFYSNWKNENNTVTNIELKGNDNLTPKIDNLKLTMFGSTKPEISLPTKIETPELLKTQTKNLTEYNYNKSTENSSPSWLSKNADYISAGISGLAGIAGSIISNRIANKALKNTEYSSAPVVKIAAPLKTTINVNPELSAIRENLAQYNKLVDDSTQSSAVAVARKQAAANQAVASLNKIYADKENRETALINQDRLNRQEVANSNIDAYNKWNENKSAFERSRDLAIAQNKADMWSDIGTGISNISNSVQQGLTTRNNMALLAASSPNVTPELLRSYGYKLKMGGKLKLKSNKKK